jgi:hypothetical protein
MGIPPDKTISTINDTIFPVGLQGISQGFVNKLFPLLQIVTNRDTLSAEQIPARRGERGNYVL